MKPEVTIDARGLNCPQPVLLTRKSIENSSANALMVIVDNEISKENVCRFLNSQGFSVTPREVSSDFFEIVASRNSPHEESSLDVTPEKHVAPKHDPSSLVVFVGTRLMGSGDEELGAKLMRGFLRTLIDMSFTPWRMIFINSGVMLTTIDEEAVEALMLLSEKGVEILSCGTCLQHYKVDQKISVGRSTTMYEVLETLEKASKVISPD